ncbi:MAG: GNAT family N-acetyltransferase [Rhodospirillales bacterium]|nr:GNAT family N-acetyltransferase [Rhodospirillales bacterium]
MAAKISSVITYLEMTSRPSSPTPARPAVKMALMRAEKPTLSFYRYLYNAIGEDWLWWERRALSDSQLSAIIHHDLVEIYVLYVGGVPAGYGELDRRQGNDIELAYFGLVPEFIGQKLGGYFLRWMIDQAWSYAPERMFVHTCTEDHPAAIHNYQRHGFEPYKQITEEIEDPRSSGLIG